MLKVDHTQLQMPGNKSQQQQQQGQQQQWGQQQQPLIGDPHPRGPGPETVLRISVGWSQFVWAPYAGREDFKWAPWLRSIWLEFLGSFVLGWVVSTVVSTATAGSVALNALTVGLTYGLFLAFFYSWRQTEFLPRHLNPALTLAELIHQHVGLVVALPYWAAQLGGAAFSAVFLNLTGGAAIPNYVAAPRPVSYWGAMGLDMFGAFFLIYAFVQNKSLRDHITASYRFRGEFSRVYRGLSSTAALSGLAALFGVLIAFPNGMWTLGNLVVYFGGAIVLGFSVPESASWTIPILWGLVGAVAAWALQILTWNVNGLLESEYTTFVAKLAAAEEKISIETQMWVDARDKTQ